MRNEVRFWCIVCMELCYAFNSPCEEYERFVDTQVNPFVFRTDPRNIKFCFSPNLKRA